MNCIPLECIGGKVGESQGKWKVHVLGFGNRRFLAVKSAHYEYIFVRFSQEAPSPRASP